MKIYFTPARAKASVGSGSVVSHCGYHIAVYGGRRWYLGLHVDPKPERRPVQAGAAYALDDRGDIAPRPILLPTHCAFTHPGHLTHVLLVVVKIANGERRDRYRCAGDLNARRTRNDGSAALLEEVEHRLRSAPRGNDSRLDRHSRR